MYEFRGEMGRDGTVVIRPSTLTSWPDCGRRSAARAYPSLFAGFGYELRPVQVSAGAAVCTAVHAGAAFTLQSKVDTGEPGRDDEAEDRAIVGFRREIESGANWDEATPRPNDGETQVRRMLAEYRRAVAPRITPIAVEKRLEADLGDGFLLSGQADALAIEPGAIRDLKTGVERIHIPQLGAYSLLARSHGREVLSAFEDFIPRVKANYSQPPAQEIAYPVEFAERVAQRRIAVVKRDLTEFLAVGDAEVFPANPMSVLCSQRYCPCWGTAACREHKGSFKEGL